MKCNQHAAHNPKFENMGSFTVIWWFNSLVVSLNKRLNKQTSFRRPEKHWQSIKVALVIYSIKKRSLHFYVEIYNQYSYAQNQVLHDLHIRCGNITRPHVPLKRPQMSRIPDTLEHQWFHRMIQNCLWSSSDGRRQKLQLDDKFQWQPVKGHWFRNENSPLFTAANE